MISNAEARELAQSLNDVFTPEGDAGVISRLYTFATPGHRFAGRGQCARVVGENVDEWFPLSVLESEATLRAQRNG